MKLPDIEYGAGNVQRVSGELGRLDEAQRRTIATINEGLARFGHELVKTETQTAAADLHAGLSEVETEIASRRYVSTQELRDAGVLDTLPPELKARVTQKNPATGEAEDRADIPMWQVAGAIYDHRAKQLLAAAGQRVSVGGWRSEFEAAALSDIQDRKNRIASHQLQAMNADLRGQQLSNVDKLVRAGRFDEAAAFVDASRLFDPAEKGKLVGEVEHARQLQPLEDRLLYGVQSAQDVVEVGKLIGRLESGDGFDQVDDKERIQWKRSLEAQVREFEHLGKDAAANRFREADEAARNTLLEAYMKRGGRPLSMALAPKPGTVSAGTLQWSINLIESTRPDRKERETDLATYAKLNNLAATDPAAFKNADLSADLEKLSVPHAIHFLDLQRTLKERGPLDPKYTSFVGPQEETNRQLVAQGYHVTGKEAEKDAEAVGYVQRETNRALWEATVAKARAGRGSELDLPERDAIITKTVARAIQDLTRAKKSTGARGALSRAGMRLQLSLEGGPEIPDDFLVPVRESSIRRGQGDLTKAIEETWTGFKANEPAIVAAWDQTAGGRALTPTVALEVFDLIARDGTQIKAALERKGKDAGPEAVAAAAVRGYLGGLR